MFLYHLNHTIIQQCIISIADNKRPLWSCLDDDQGNYYLVLWDTIHRPHLYNISHWPWYLKPSISSTTKDNLLLSQHSINLIHHLTYEYYTHYRSIISRFVPHDIDKTIIKKPRHHTSSQPQQLLILPDRRTIVHQQDHYWYTIHQAIGSQHTINQDIKLFRDIAQGTRTTIVCTPGECFWDYCNLTTITIVDHNKRYYKTQQEPRYDIMRVCELMAHYHWAALQIHS